MMKTKIKIYRDLLPGSASLPALDKIAAECGGAVVRCPDFTHAVNELGHGGRVWPARNDDPGDRYQGQTLVAQGWDGTELHGVIM
jgi:hypothetical protein